MSWMHGRWFIVMAVAVATADVADASPDAEKPPRAVVEAIEAGFDMMPGLQDFGGKPAVVAEAYTGSSWLSFRKIDHVRLRAAIERAAMANNIRIEGGEVRRIGDAESTLPIISAREGMRAIAVAPELDGGDLVLHLWAFDAAAMTGTRFDIKAPGEGIVSWNTNKITTLVVVLLLAAGGLVLWRTFRNSRRDRPEPVPAPVARAPVAKAPVARSTVAASSAVAAGAAVEEPAASTPRLPDEGIPLSEGALALLDAPPLEVDHGAQSTPRAASTPRPASIGTDHTVAAAQAPPPSNAPAAAASGSSSAATVALDGKRDATRIRGRYRIVAELGRGAMGVVYRAFDEHLERHVAIKALSDALRDHPEAYRLFASEAKALAQLQHPNLVALYDQISDAGEAYLVMEFVEGAPLDRVLERDGPYSWRDALLLTYHLCGGLAHAHGKNIIHRDIKPANIFIMPDGLPKLGDFGLARVLRELVIRSTEVRGTPLYMAPEQITGTMIDHRADLYAVGCTLFELITGRPPFIDGEILYQQLSAEPPRPSTLIDDLPAPVEELVLSLLAKDAANRPATANALRDQIRAIVR